LAGQIRKRGDRTWLVRVYLGRDPATGKRKWLSRTVHGTRRDAASLLHSLLRDRDLGKVTIPSGMPLGEFAEKWLADVRGRVRPRTAAWYEDVLRRWILPVLGSRRLRDITVLLPGSCVRAVVEESAGGPGRGRLSPGTRVAPQGACGSWSR